MNRAPGLRRSQAKIVMVLRVVEPDFHSSISLVTSENQKTNRTSN